MLAYILSFDFLYSVIKISVPLVMGSLAASVVQKGKLINIGIEGIMLISALLGVIFADIFHNVWLSFAITIIFGMSFSSIMGLFIIKFKANDVITGIAFNLLATGLAGVLLFAYSGDRGVSTSIPTYNIDSDFFIIMSIIATIVVYILLYKTNFGYNVDGISKNEEACRHSNIPVDKIKYILFMLSGLFSSIGGFYMSCSYMSKFSEGIIAGRGFIVLASSAMAGNNPVISFFTASLFGLAKHLADYFQLYNVSSNLISLVPYVIYLFLIVFYGYKVKRV